MRSRRAAEGRVVWTRNVCGGGFAGAGMGMGEDGGNVKSGSGCCTRGVPVGSDGREGEDSGEDDAGVEMGDDGGRTSSSAALSSPSVAGREDGGRGEVGRREAERARMGVIGGGGSAGAADVRVLSH